MGLNYTACHYHPDRVAVTVYERCRRPICLEDKRIYRKKHSRGVGDNVSYYYTQHDYCILCNASQLRLDANPAGILIAIPIILFFFIMIPSSFMDIGFFNPILLMFGGFIIIFALAAGGSIISARTRAQNAENEAYQFKSSLYSSSDFSSKPSFEYHKNSPVPESYEDKYYQQSFKDVKKSSDVFSIVCFECGAQLSLNDKFCPNCGDSTHDELVNYYKLHPN